ncbi:MAG: hypothetical protein H0X25_16140 [Acidobacteriales bacterium]|nr:hypothetical protein [Terriglobales bacterium]
MGVAEGIVTARGMSEAWLRTLLEVDKATGRKMFHVVTKIECPLPEAPPIRAAADRLLRSVNHASVETVANTIFPAQMADTSADYKALSARYTKTYDTIRRVHKDNRRGTYFGRLVSHPSPRGQHDQLSALIEKLSAEHSNLAPKSARYEVNIAEPAERIPADQQVAYRPDESVGMNVYAAGVDNSIMGFPCLSFCSFQLEKERLHLVAHYRAQRLVQRGYGNYLGLARLQAYVAGQVGIQAGQLTIVVGRADADAPQYRIRSSLADVAAE